MNKPSRGTLRRGKVTINQGSNLRCGDEVVVVEPLNTLVKSSRTGRVLGKDERVLGRGKIVQENGYLSVQIGKNRFGGKFGGAEKLHNVRRVAVKDGLEIVTLKKGDLSAKKDRGKESIMRGKKTQRRVIVKLINDKLE